LGTNLDLKSVPRTEFVGQLKKIDKFLLKAVITHKALTPKHTREMVHASAINNDDFDATTQSVGCATALVPQRMRDSAKAVNTWYRTSSSFIMRVPSGGFLKKERTAKTPSVDPREAWAEMRRRFKAAHDRPASRAASEGALSAWQSPRDSIDAPHSKSAKELFFFSKGSWDGYVSPQPVEVSCDLCA